MKESRALTVKGLLEKNKTALTACLPKHLSIERFNRTAINAIATTPKLAECTAQSLFLSIVKAAAVGLEPGGILGHGHLVPFWNGKKNCYEAQFMPGYQGMIDIAYRSGLVSIVYAEEVREEDFIEINSGLYGGENIRGITHKINVKRPRGAVIGYYACYALVDGNGGDFVYMTCEEIEKVRLCSKSPDKGPWLDWPELQSKKTLIKRLFKTMPKSIEMAKAIAVDNEFEAGSTDSSAVIDVDFDLPDDAEIARQEHKDDTSKKVAKLRADLADPNAGVGRPHNESATNKEEPGVTGERPDIDFDIDFNDRKNIALLDVGIISTKVGRNKYLKYVREVMGHDPGNLTLKQAEVIKSDPEFIEKVESYWSESRPAKEKDLSEWEKLYAEFDLLVETWDGVIQRYLRAVYDSTVEDYRNDYIALNNLMSDKNLEDKLKKHALEISDTSGT